MIGRPKTIEEVLKNRQCTGCGGCAAIAPGAIQMTDTEDENLRPKFKRQMTSFEAKQTERACPEITSGKGKKPENIVDAAWGPVLEVWEGFAVDEDIRFRGSSGGATTALALFAIEEIGYSGALHVKAKKSDPRFNEAALSTNRKELLEGAGSRYAPASVCDGLDKVKAAPWSCMIVGKPCDIRAAKRLASVDPAGLGKNMGITVSIFCAGTPSHKGTEALLKFLNPDHSDSAEVTQLDYRGNGWPGEMKATWRHPDGQKETHSTSYSEGWGDILQKHRQWRCMTCEDHTGEYADISIGDPWQNPTDDDKKGSSLIIVRTEAGRAFLRAAAAKKYVHVSPHEKEVLFDAQPNLFVTKGAVWGRRVAMRLAQQKTTPLSAASFKCWSSLSFKGKAQSILGTLKRIYRRGLFRPKQTAWLPTGGEF